jgi:hypothetical protein
MLCPHSPQASPLWPSAHADRPSLNLWQGADAGDLYCLMLLGSTYFQMGQHDKGLGIMEQASVRGEPKAYSFWARVRHPATHEEGLARGLAFLPLAGR